MFCKKFSCYFSLKTMSLSSYIMEQCRLCPAQSWSLHTAKLCRLCPAKSRRHSFRGQNNITNYLKTIFSSPFLYFFVVVNQCYFRNLYNHLENFWRKTYFVSWYLKAVSYLNPRDFRPSGIGAFWVSGCFGYRDFIGMRTLEPAEPWLPQRLATDWRWVEASSGSY